MTVKWMQRANRWKKLKMTLWLGNRGDTTDSNMAVERIRNQEKKITLKKVSS